MKLTVERDGLLDAVEVVLPATRSKSLPILSGIRIDVDGTGIATVCGTDLELTIEHRLDARGDTGTVVVPAAPLHRIVKSMGAGAVTISHTQGDDVVAITTTGQDAELRPFPADEWPKAEEPPDTEVIELGPDTIDGLSRVLHAASHDLSRPILCGVSLEGNSMLATDSYRAARADVAVTLPTALVPVEAVKAILGREPSALAVKASQNRLWAASGHTTWTVSLIAGDFPSLDNFWRDEHDATVTVQVDAMIDALGAMGALADDNDGTATLFSGADGVLTLRKTQPDTGTIERTLDYVGDSLEAVGLRAQFLRDIVRQVHADDVTLGFKSRTHPVQVVDDGARFILMPIRVKA